MGLVLGILMQLRHFGEFGQCAPFHAGGLLLHLAHRDMHPHQRHGDQCEEHHETARPDTGKIAYRTEDDRQDETTQPADQAHHAADRANMVGIVDGNVLVDRSLAQRHEEAEHEDRHHERH